MVDLVLQNGTLLTPMGEIQADIAVQDGRIVAIGQDLPAAEVLNVRGLHVLPGMIDSQVHFREPGLEHKEDLESGTRGAVLGGITTVFEMPNTKPSTTTAAALADKVSRARGRAWTDFAFFIGAAAENADDLASLETLPACCGVKVFMGSSTGNLLIPDDELLERVLRHGHRSVSIHAEDEARLSARKSLAEEAAHPRAHPIWRDEETALNATRRAVTIARKSRRRVHILHVTTAEEMAFLGQNKDVATVEVLPQHLTLSAPECYERLGTYAQMNPPIRDARHQEALWQAVRCGIVDVVASDHAPHTHAEKALAYPQSPSGLTGVQTMLPLMLNHVHEGRLTLSHLCELMSAAPARIMGAKRKGRIAVGYDADFTVVDVKANRTITNAWIASKVGWTPFDGMRVTGWPLMTIIRGKVVMRDDTLQGQALGEAVQFWQ